MDRFFISATLFLLLAPTAFASPGDDADRAALLNNVHSIVAPGGLPGDVVVFGPNSFTVLTGRMGRANLPEFAAAHFGSGRIVVGGHEAFFDREALNSPDNVQFARNVAAWAGGKSRGLRIALIGQNSTLKDVLRDDDAKVMRAGEAADQLSRLDVVWMDQAALDSDAGGIEKLIRWVKAGGGIVIDGPGWGWQQLHPGKDLGTDQSGNRIAIPMGLAFAGGSLSGRRDGGFTVAADAIKNSSAREALASLEDATAAAPGPNDLAQISAVLGEAIGTLTASGGEFVQRVTRLCADKGGAVPTRLTPITTAMPFARLRAALDFRRITHTPPELIKADPSAQSFPGPVPADAQRVKRTVRIDANVPQWHGMGLYAPPGEVVTVSIPQSVAGKGYSVRIGEHTDSLWNLDKWERFPEISMSRPLTAVQTRVASPFGGTIFVDVPERAAAGEIEVTVSGAVEAPRFVRGVTTRQQWLNSIRSAPGPWAELVGRYVALSVPSSAVRDLEDPEALMAYWDDVMENCYTFFSAPKRGRPERYCVDIQISAGYMHSGYPIMTGDDVARTFCDLSVLRGSSGIKCWGFYHEMGHNFQQPEWTWAPFGEVTNNLFSLYGTEKLNGAMIGAHPAMTEAEMDKRLKVIAAAPGAERYYAKDPWYPLTMFWLMRKQFGWAPFTNLFAEFRDLPSGEKPHTEQEKHDAFLIRFSRLTGHNLTAYLKAWGVELSPTAVNQVSSLPTWLPAGL